MSHILGVGHTMSHVHITTGEAWAGGSTIASAGGPLFPDAIRIQEVCQMLSYSGAVLSLASNKSNPNFGFPSLKKKGRERERMRVRLSERYHVADVAVHHQ